MMTYPTHESSYVTRDMASLLSGWHPDEIDALAYDDRLGGDPPIRSHVICCRRVVHLGDVLALAAVSTRHTLDELGEVPH